jgi:hypothetical protein
MPHTVYSQDDDPAYAEYEQIASQFANALDTDSAKPAVIPRWQWFGKVLRFGFTLTAPNSISLEEDEFYDAINNGEISFQNVAVDSYTKDVGDPTIAYVEGEMEIIDNGNSPIPAGNYKVTHTIKQVWRITSTEFS